MSITKETFNHNKRAALHRLNRMRATALRKRKRAIKSGNLMSGIAFHAQAITASSMAFQVAASAFNEEVVVYG